jgi:hypothetical protein
MPGELGHDAYAPPIEERATSAKRGWRQRWREKRVAEATAMAEKQAAVHRTFPGVHSDLWKKGGN